jgi:hypothetical protein
VVQDESGIRSVFRDSGLRAPVPSYREQLMTKKMTSLKVALLSVLILGSLCFSEICFCNQYKEISLAKKVEYSDLVLIVKVIAVTSKVCAPMNRCASVSIKSTLKGSAPKDIQMLFGGPIAESDPLCCKVGSTYLVFLKNVKGKYYQSANGPYGIYLTNAEHVARNVNGS